MVTTPRFVTTHACLKAHDIGVREVEQQKGVVPSTTNCSPPFSSYAAHTPHQSSDDEMNQQPGRAGVDMLDPPSEPIVAPAAPQSASVAPEQRQQERSIRVTAGPSVSRAAISPVPDSGSDRCRTRTAQKPLAPPFTRRPTGPAAPTATLTTTQATACEAKCPLLRCAPCGHTHAQRTHVC